MWCYWSPEYGCYVDAGCIDDYPPDQGDDDSDNDADNNSD
jgi:hypothetical protein